MISLWMVQGQVQMQAGLEADGEQSLNEALRLAQSRTDLPRPCRLFSSSNVFHGSEHSNCLKWMAAMRSCLFVPMS
jgi:hypothetical protein